MVIGMILTSLVALFLLLFPKRKPKKEAKTKIRPSVDVDVMGKTKVVLRQMQTNADMPGQVSKPKDNPDTFAADNQNESDNEPMNISVPLEFEPKNSDNESDADEEDEALRQLTGETAFASGASFEELEHSYEVVRERKTSEEDEQRAAEILRREGTTDIFQQMVSQVPQGAERVMSILDKYYPTPTASMEPSTDKDYGDFDIANIL